VNVRPLVASLEVLDDRHLVLEVRLPAKDNLKITEVLAAIFGMPTDRAADLRILKTRVRLEEAQSLFTLNNPPESTLRSGIPPAAGVWLKD
jgi:hypothetical protein